MTRDRHVADAMNALRRIVQALHRSSRAAEQTHGVSGAQLFVLQLLADSPAQSVNALSARTMTHQSSVSVVVSRLVARGLVERTRSSADGRRMELRLSPAGLDLLRVTPAAMQIRLIDSLEAMAPGEIRTLAASLTHLAGALGAGDQSAEFFFEEPPGDSG